MSFKVYTIPCDSDLSRGDKFTGGGIYYKQEV